MSGANKEHPETAVLLSRAEHAGAAYAQDLNECRAMLDLSGLHYLAHLTTGIIDFDFGFPSRWQDGPDLPEAYQRAGRQFGLAVTLLESACEPLDSGPLIRVVLQGEEGAMFLVVKVAGQSFFGLTLDGAPAAVDRLDWQLVALADAASQRVGASSLRWGGFRVREDSGDLWLPYVVQPRQQRTAAPHVADYGPRSGLSETAEELTAPCLEALHSHDLHYVGIFRHGQPVWRADIFDDQVLAPLFQRVTPWSRRRGYERLVRQVSLQSRRFRQLLALVHSDSLNRLVLDVARGAIYVLPLDDDASLVGVTLIQAQVESTDQKLRRLRDTVNAVTRQLKIAQRADRAG